MHPDTAIRTVARRVLWDLAQNVHDGLWESYPDIGENDWLDVVQAVEALAPLPDAKRYETAYALLAARADR